MPAFYILIFCFYCVKVFCFFFLICTIRSIPIDSLEHPIHNCYAIHRIFLKYLLHFDKVRVLHTHPPLLSPYECGCLYLSHGWCIPFIYLLVHIGWSCCFCNWPVLFCACSHSALRWPCLSWPIFGPALCYQHHKESDGPRNLCHMLLSMAAAGSEGVNTSHSACGSHGGQAGRQCRGWPLTPQERNVEALSSRTETKDTRAVGKWQFTSAYSIVYKEK